MRKLSVAAVLVLSLTLAATLATAGGFRGEPGGWIGPGPFAGNDTGGIIAWSPEIDPIYRDIAADHCAAYNKVAEITSAHRWYGDYIAFRCHFPRGYDPRKWMLYGPPLRALN